MFPGRPIAGASRATREPRFPPTPATGCSNEIAKKIKRGGGDYVLAVKDNQPNLHQAIEEFFVEALEDDLGQVSHRRHETHETGHGRMDDRYYYLAKLPSDFAFKRLETEHTAESRLKAGLRTRVCQVHAWALESCLKAGLRTRVRTSCLFLTRYCGT